MKRLNVTMICQAVYNSSILVPDEMSLSEAIAYAATKKDEIPLGTLEYIPDSDELDEDNCDFNNDTVEDAEPEFNATYTTIWDDCFQKDTRVYVDENNQITKWDVIDTSMDDQLEVLNEEYVTMDDTGERIPACNKKDMTENDMPEIELSDSQIQRLVEMFDDAYDANVCDNDRWEHVIREYLEQINA